MDDTLVPYITQDKYEDAATSFLKNHYPEALKISEKGKAPIWVDPTQLAHNLGLDVKQHTSMPSTVVF